MAEDPAVWWLPHKGVWQLQFCALDGLKQRYLFIYFGEQILIKQLEAKQ